MCSKIPLWNGLPVLGIAWIYLPITKVCQRNPSSDQRLCMYLCDVGGGCYRGGIRARLWVIDISMTIFTKEINKTFVCILESLKIILVLTKLK